MLIFLLPFKRCTAHFECNNSSPEIDYVFFAYNTMYDHMDDIKSKLESGISIGALLCAKYMLKAISEMEKVLKKYYTKTSFPTVYGDGMILNPRMKLIIFEEESWADTTLRNIPMPVVDIFSNSTTNLNPILPPPPLRGSPVVQAATNVRGHITMIRNIAKPFSTVHLNDAAMISIATSRSPTIPISHLHFVGGEIIIINTRIWEGWSGMCWLCLRQAVQLNVSLVYLGR